MKVLVADDDAVSRLMICNLLRKNGYQTTEASDGLEALECLQRPDAPGLAVLDWMMPRLDGVEVCRRLRSQVTSHYTYILLVTSRAQKSDLLTGLEAGADDYLIKPFDFSELQVRLQVGRRILQAEEQMRQAQRIEAMGLLTGGIAHDFNNIVMIINSYCDMLLDDVSDPEARAKLQQVHKAGQRAASLTHQLLAFSRQQVISPVLVNVNEIIRELVPMLQRLVGEHIRVETALAPALWHTKADPGQIERVLLNLAANARDAMPTGGRVTISTTNTVLDQTFVDCHLGSRSGAYVMISVTDTGCGMSRQVQNHVFDPFFTTKQKGHGTGMGLASVYGVVKQSEGYITVDSEVGKGATFTIYLPKSDEAVPKCAETETAKHDTSAGQLVLVVEDEDSTRDAICNYLKARGYQVLSAASARGALDIYTKSTLTPGIVLTDVLMPEMSGTELAKEILNINPKAKLIFMSGYAGKAIDREMSEMAQFRFLQKPFQLADLVDAINETAGAHT